MARLFVVNCTAQDRIVHYRTESEFTVDEEGRRTSERMRPYRTLPIAARKQIQFGGNLSIKQIHTIIAQLERTCGAVPVKDITTAKAKGVVQMIWNVDQPVPLAVLKDVVLHNISTLSEQGEERRRRLAIAANFNMAGLSDPATDTVRDTSVEFESIDTTEDPDLPAPSLAEGIKIAKGRAPRGGSRAKKAA